MIVQVKQRVKQPIRLIFLQKFGRVVGIKGCEMNVDFEMFKQLISILAELGFVTVFWKAVSKWGKYLNHKKVLQQNKDNVQNQKIIDLGKSDILLKAGVVAMLHHELYANCTEYISRGYVTPGQLNDLEYIFTSYKALGGNGTGEILYKKVQVLKIKEEE